MARALRIMDALIKAMGSRGMRVALGDRRKPGTYVTVLGETIGFRIREKLGRVDHRGKDRDDDGLTYMGRRAWTYYPKGQLELRMDFGQYRFSEDLDSSTVGEVPRGEAMAAAVAAACEEAARLLDEYAPVTLQSERCTERDPHPTGQEAFTIRAQFPWHRRPQVRVMVEVSVDEPVMSPAPERAVVHEYGESLDAQVKVYSLEEIVAEKLRAILQHVAKLEERGRSRSRARDYYDL